MACDVACCARAKKLGCERLQRPREGLPKGLLLCLLCHNEIKVIVFYCGQERPAQPHHITTHHIAFIDAYMYRDYCVFVCMPSVPASAHPCVDAPARLRCARARACHVCVHTCMHGCVCICWHVRHFGTVGCDVEISNSNIKISDRNVINCS